MSHKKLIPLILNSLKTIAPQETNELILSLTIDPELTRAANTLSYESHWKFETIENNLIRKISTEGFKILSEKKDVISLEIITSKIAKNLNLTISESLIKSILEIDKRNKFIQKGVGLIEWRHINPKTLRDKIQFIMERDHKPLHFLEIAEKIRKSNFDAKRINNQAVHNELIRNNHFVLIGRGLYALDKWGYESGTVGEVINKILADGKAKTREEIIKEVLKQRQVKKITIYLNLKNSSKIKSLKGDRYQLAL
ncbi:MAG: hypothetical protein UT55_C0034G0001 [Candidatus Peregrinibacteria bacterium GW2011_GWE2_39_6]|nr:MAG: hypothetical protein UT55_C0034G0001 [Candidatus Peregrinibacteria bacterium GW2011_GWE2_39_6]